MEQALRAFTDFLSARGLRFTSQRRCIVTEFMKQSGHISVEELYTHVLAADPSIGQATIYRTVKLLCESGLAKEAHFGDGVARYETLLNSAHHDHLVCLDCGKKIEVVDPAIEQLQEKMAKRHNFILTSHHMYLYGICGACRKQRSAQPPSVAG